MNCYDLDANPDTLENQLVYRLRSCWNKHPCPDTYVWNNLKDAISELRTFRTNRKLNPELHAQLDAEAVDNYRGSGWLGYPEYKWEIFCRNKHLLTRTRLNEPMQESLIKKLPVPTEQPKGRVRTRPPAEKISKDYFTATRTAIDKGELTPYLPVRQMCSFIMERTAQQEFLHKIRMLADDQRDHPDHKRDFKRIHRLANRVLNELHEQARQGTLF